MGIIINTICKLQDKKYAKKRQLNRIKPPVKPQLSPKPTAENAPIPEFAEAADVRVLHDRVVISFDTEDKALVGDWSGAELLLADENGAAKKVSSELSQTGEAVFAVMLAELDNGAEAWTCALLLSGNQYKIKAGEEYIKLLKAAAKNVYCKLDDNYIIKLEVKGNNTFSIKKTFETAIARADGRSVKELLAEKYIKSKVEVFSEFDCTSDSLRVKVDGLAPSDCDEIFFVFQNEKKKIAFVYDAVADGEYITATEFNDLPSDEYKLSVAYQKSGFYYLIRLLIKRQKREVGFSVITTNSYRFFARISNGDSELVLCTGANNNAVSAFCGDKEKCDSFTEPKMMVSTSNCHQYYPYKVSVIMAVYNVEQYLDEAVQSVINQDIGFKNVQLILVDDGSTDSSPEICDRYASMYDNIVVIHKENGGVACARNSGMELATGKYINCMDSDDALSPCAFSSLYSFMETNYDKTDVACLPIYYFGADEGDYWQNYKFRKGKRVADLRAEYQVSNMNAGASIVKNEVFKKYRFDTRLINGEDLKLLLQIMAEKQTLGVVRGTCKYMYRKREAGGGSLIQTAKQKKEYYESYCKYELEEIWNWAEEKFGFVPYFIQNTLMMDLQWKLLAKEFPEGTLNEKEQEKYKSFLKSFLKKIDDDIIFGQQKLFPPHIHQIMKIKYGDEVVAEKVFKDIKYQYKNVYYRTEAEIRFKLDSIDTTGDKLKIKGCSYLLEKGENVTNYISIGGYLWKCKAVEADCNTADIFGTLLYGYAFEAEIANVAALVDKGIFFYTEVDGHMIARRNVVYGEAAPITHTVRSSYAVLNDYIVRRNGNGIAIEKYSDEALESREDKLRQELVEKKIGIIDELLEIRDKCLKGIDKQSKLVLVSEEALESGDIDESLTAMSEGGAEIVVISGLDESTEIKWRKVPYNSKEAERLTLLADCIVYSGDKDKIFSVFDWKRKYIKDVLKAKYILPQEIEA